MAGIRIYEAEVVGNLPLLMHNSQLADPLNAHTKAVKALTSLKVKTDEHHVQIAEAEYQGGLYIDDQIGPYIPGDMIEACLYDAAARMRKKKSFKATVTTPESMYRLEYEGPRTREGLVADPRFRDYRSIKVSDSKRIMRTRPRFNEWSAKFTLQLFPGDVTPDMLERALTDAGMYHGFGDYRPKFGLFSLKSFKELARK